MDHKLGDSRWSDSSRLSWYLILFEGLLTSLIRGGSMQTYTNRLKCINELDNTHI
jgi:hypothetical protein